MQRRLRLLRKLLDDVKVFYCIFPVNTTNR